MSAKRLSEALRKGRESKDPAGFLIYEGVHMDVAAVLDEHRKLEGTIPMIRGAIMLLVELREMHVPKEGHWNKHINARIDSLKSRLDAITTTQPTPPESKI
jgi:hypothetical protein